MQKNQNQQIKLTAKLENQHQDQNNEDISVQKEIKKRGRKPKSKVYFTQETEDSIILYNSIEDPEEKNKIYMECIKQPFEKIAENIINTYKFPYIPECFVDIQSTVVSHMFLNLYRYEKNNGKAFSYFSVVCKNYLIIWNNTRLEELTKSISTSTIDNSEDHIGFDVIDDSYITHAANSDIQDFVALMTEYWDENITSIFKKKRDIDIAFAVNELFKRPASIEVFNKKALYLLIREMTGHKTQYITKVVNKMMGYYKKIHKQYYNGGMVRDNDFF